MNAAGVLRDAARRWGDLLRLQLGGRWMLFFVADAVLILAGIFSALVGEGDSMSQAYFTVVVGSGTSAPFAISTNAAPQTLLLDPDSTCLRWKSDPPGVLLDKVDLEAALAESR